MRWPEDLARIEAVIVRRTELTNIEVAEELTHQEKLEGHGKRVVGVNRGRRSETIVFYPVGGLAGSRVIIIQYGAPNFDSLREMKSFVNSVSHAAEE